MRCKLMTLVQLCLLLTVLSVQAKSVSRKDSLIVVLILPAHDLIANIGGSPDTRRILETALLGKENLNVLKFPSKRLMNVRYQMVYDKKYCKEIQQKVDCDIIIMSQIITDNERKPGIWPWAYKVRVYNTRTGKQLDSIHGENLEAEDFNKDINSKISTLLSDIQLSFKNL